jgi:hypothetical protein
MKKLSLSLLAILFCNFFTGNVIAQSDKVSFRIVPKPNHTSQYTLTQEMVMEGTFVGEVPGPFGLTNTVKMEVKLVMGLINKTGSIDKDGRLEAEIAFDQVNTEMTINGSQHPFGEHMKKFIGKKTKIIIDRKGELLDFSLPDDSSIPYEALGMMLQTIYGNRPFEPLSIGETAILPLNMDFPVPVPLSPLIKLDSKVKTKLVSLGTGTNGRVAKFDHTTEAKIINTIELDWPSGKVPMNIDLNMNGSGTTQFILDTGLVKASEIKMTLDGKIVITTDLQLPEMLTKGTIKATVVSTN